MVEEGATSEDDNGKNVVVQKLTNLQKKSEKQVLPQSAVTEQWIRAIFAGAQYVVNAPQKFAQIVLIERHRQVPCFCKILWFCKQQLDYELFSFKRCWYPKSVFYVW